MRTPKEYRHQAKECSELARKATDLYAREAMQELAEEFNKAADAAEKLERHRHAA